MITQNNKNQSDIRKNLTNILGLTETEEKLTVKNSERILGSQGAFYFGNNPQTGEPDGCGCGNHPQNPNGDGDGDGGNGDGDGDGGNGDGDGDGDDNPYECECVEVSDNLKNPCCVSGYDCQTGQTINLQRRGGGAIECKEPPPYGGASTVVIRFNKAVAFNQPQVQVYKLSEIESAAGAAAAAMSESQQSFISVMGGRCGGTTGMSDCTYQNAQKNGVSVRYCSRQVIYFKSCTAQTSTVNIILNPNETQYNQALANWKKEQTAQYYSENGKIYNACDPYGEPTQDCIDMCDSSGNKYRVCGNGNITKLS